MLSNSPSQHSQHIHRGQGTVVSYVSAPLHVGEIIPTCQMEEESAEVLCLTWPMEATPARPALSLCALKPHKVPHRKAFPIGTNQSCWAAAQGTRVFLLAGSSRRRRDEVARAGLQRPETEEGAEWPASDADTEKAVSHWFSCVLS